MRPQECLQEARKVIEVPERWSQGYFARDFAHDRCPALDPRARSFCVLGAIKVVCGGNRILEEDAVTYLYLALYHFGGTSIAGFNDHYATTHSQVLELLDRAIEEASELDPN